MTHRPRWRCHIEGCPEARWHTDGDPEKAWTRHYLSTHWTPNKEQE